MVAWLLATSIRKLVDGLATLSVQPSIAVLADCDDDGVAARILAAEIGCEVATTVSGYDLVLERWNSRLQLRDLREPRSRPMYVDLTVDLRRSRRFPLAKRGPLARAIGRRTRTVVDATAGWGEDTRRLFMMGYTVTAVERSPAIAALFRDAVRRLEETLTDKSAAVVPTLVASDARDYLMGLAEPPDCVYLDPMFPPKRKVSALARRNIRLLRELVGDDEDAQELFSVAAAVARRRVVVKRPDHAPPLRTGAAASIPGKLVRYDVYLRILEV